MYARVAKWEGAGADQLRAAAEELNERASQGPPEGVPSVGFMLLVDPDNGQAMGIGLFETEEDYRKGHETLESMSPPGDGFGNRVSVDKYEVAADLRAG
jgi:hypothetical protein